MYSIVKTSRGNCVIDISGLYFVNSDEELRKCIQNIENSKYSGIDSSDTYSPAKQKMKLGKVAIYVSENCNLRCIYCYANSGSNNAVVSVESAKTLINFVADKTDKIILDFHGGGEPLLYFDLIKELRDYVKSLGKLYKTVLITNGVIENNTEQVLDWIVNNVDILAISCDGTPEIQDANRPNMNGEPTSKMVEHTIKYLIGKKYNFTIRSTITNESTNKLYDIMQYFHNLGVHNVIFSPCYNFGRSTSKELLPMASTYAESFMRAFEYAYKNNINIRTNSFRVPGRYYCGALSGFNLGLTTDNYISTCYEIINCKDKSGYPFIIGKIEQNSVIIFEEKINMLEEMNLRDNNCQSCKFKLVCRGGCPIKYVRGDKEASNNLCIITKTLVPKILDFIHNNPESANILLRNIEILD